MPGDMNSFFTFQKVQQSGGSASSKSSYGFDPYSFGGYAYGAYGYDQSAQQSYGYDASSTGAAPAADPAYANYDYSAYYQVYYCYVKCLILLATSSYASSTRSGPSNV